MAILTMAFGAFRIPVRLFSLLMAAVAVVTGGTASAQTAAGTTPASLAVTPDGTSSYSVPLVVPPGTAGVEPKLSLVYSSRGGVSAYGFGWSVSGLSQIHRGPRNLTDDGRVAGVRFSADDALTLDGEKLVEVASATAGFKEYRTRIDTFVRVRAYAEGASGSGRIVVETRAGLTMSYGSTPRSRVSLADGRTVTWLCDRIEDRSGNYMAFRYRFDDVGGSQGLDYVLAGVDYGGNERLGRPGYAAIEFDYERLPAGAEYGSRFLFGQRTTLAWRLKSIVSSYRGAVLRRYVPTYTPSSDGDRFFTIATLAEEGADGLRYRPLSFEYPTARPGWQPSDILASIPDLPDVDEALADVRRAYRFARLPTAAGVVPAVLVSVEAGGKTVQGAYLQDAGTGAWRAVKGLAPPVLFAKDGMSADDVVLADVDGDGDDDIVAGNGLAGNVAGTYVADPSGWTKGPALPIALSGGTLATSGVLQVDVVDPAGVRVSAFAWNHAAGAGSRAREVRRWDGARWAAVAGYAPPLAFSGATAPVVSGVRSIDVDADGTRELVYYSVAGSSIHGVYRATASGWRLVNDPTMQPAIPDLPADGALRVADMDGDGHDDFVWSFDNGAGQRSGAALAGSAGWRSDARTMPAVPFWRAGDDVATGLSGDLMDVDGDGAIDFVSDDASGRSVYRAQADYWILEPRLTPPTALGATLGERMLAFRLLSLPGSGARTWLELRPVGRLAPTSYRLDAATGWRRDVSLAVPIDLAQFDKVDLGVRFLDLNNDGLPDLLWARKRKDGSLDRAAYIFQPAEDVPWRKDERYLMPVALVQEDYSATGTFVADVNGDGRVDLMEGRRVKERGGSIDRRETWINCAALTECADVPEGKVGGYWLAASGTDAYRGLVAPAVFAEDGTGPLGAQVLDVNGDGLTDIVTSRTVEVWVDEDGEDVSSTTPDARPEYRLQARTWLNEGGTSWKESEAFKLPVALARPLVGPRPGVILGDEAPFPGVTVVDTRVQLMDLDGDRLPDVAYRYEAIQRERPATGPLQNVRVTVSGARLGSSAGWSTDAPGYLPPVRLDDDPAAGERQLQMEDVNGDGSIDLLYSGGETSETYLNTGTGWSAPDAYYRIPAKAIRAGKGDQGFRVLDLNGDMLPDIAYHWTTEGGTTRGAFMNTGAGWAEAPADFAPGIPFAEHDRGDVGVRPLDVNGDGLLDLVQSYKRSDSETRNQVTVNVSDRPYLLTAAVDGIGRSTSVRYRSFLALQRPSELSALVQPVRMAPGTGRQSRYPVVHAPLPGYLVAEVASRGPGVAARHVRYAYDGNRVDVRSGRSLGFESSVSVDVERDRTTLTTFSQEDATLGSPVSVEVRQGGKVVSTTASVWQVQTRVGLDGSSGVPGFAPRIVRRSLASTASRSFGLDGVTLASEDTAFKYDGNGNPTKVVAAFADGSTSTTVNQYADDEARWALARLVAARVTLSLPGMPDQVREATFEYDAATGLIERERTLVGTPLELATEYERDPSGNKVASVTSRPDGGQRREDRLRYDAEGRFPVEVINAMGHRSAIVYDAVSGAVLSQIDPNGLTTRKRYDSLQRLLAETTPAGVVTTVSTNQANVSWASLVTSRRTPGMPEARFWTDAAGRAVRTETQGWRGRRVIAETKYDALGRLAATTLPRFEGERELKAERTYDALDRVMTETRPDGAVVRVEYRGLEVISTDVAGVRTVKRLDLRGRVAETVDALGGVTRICYDAGGRVASTETVGGRSVRQSYDVGGNRVEMTDSSIGRWAYAYDVYGSLIEQTDPRGSKLSMDYDALGRLIAKRTGGATSTWRYDAGSGAVGRLIGTESGGRRRAIAYDELGRPVRVRATSATDVLTTIDRFDRLGRLEERRFDTGVTLTNRYDAWGFMIGMSLIDGTVRRDVYGLLDVDAAGHVLSERTGVGIVTRNRFEAANGRMTGTATTATKGAVQDLAIGYNVAGDVISLADAATGEGGTFAYDALRRLVRSELTGRDAVSVAYDPLGNILSKTDAGAYSYCDVGLLRGLLCSVQGTAGTIGMEYDLAGNVVRRGDKTLTFGTDGKVSEIRGAAGSRSKFEYDGDGNLVFQESVYGPRQHRYSTTYFTGVQLIRENYAPPGLPTPERTIIRHALATQAGVFGYYDKVYRHFPYRFAAPTYGLTMTQKPERVTDLRFGLSFLVRDQLGSVRAVLAEDGRVLDRFRYDPWGRRIEGEGYRYRNVRQGFTGHEMLDNLDLVHMGGRVYDPLLGRFMSGDPYVQAPEFSQSYNRYSYVLNNPLVLTDPTGYWSLGRALGGLFERAVRAFGSVVDAVIGKPLAWIGEQLAKGGRWLEQNWQTVAIIAIACVMPAATVWYAAVLQGAAMGALSAALYGGGPDEILRGALIGGATAGAFNGVGSIGIENQALAAGAHGVVGGASSLAQGGTFESGFLSAAVTKASGNFIDPKGGQAYQVASAAVVGGVTSQISGGSFENGAVTGAFSRLFNDLAVHLSEPEPREIVVVVNDNTPIIGTHTGVFLGDEVLYDPGGVFERDHPTLKQYVGRQVNDDGPNVRVYRFKVTQGEFDQISRRFDAGSNSGAPGLCSANCGALIRGVGPFRDLGSTRTPRGMGSELDDLILKGRGVCQQPSGIACK
ncbi:RHS repeat-associated core domain-containing protein [Sphingomonas pokkalii]|uniref:Uncharacterized protein n=1 Tax=Sphingomonas pokkalii TaxID=2175090 RepID=A0A2U0SAK5_9SPHN|nr:RHS repeat-associated core domain-containing protein [Sphingomonas pokkalii]PVX28408.1 hypothetical protein DD559_02840 [Sphingomonas pokkalii]